MHPEWFRPAAPEKEPLPRKLTPSLLTRWQIDPQYHEPFMRCLYADDLLQLPENKVSADVLIRVTTLHKMALWIAKRSGQSFEIASEQQRPEALDAARATFMPRNLEDAAMIPTAAADIMAPVPDFDDKALRQEYLHGGLPQGEEEIVALSMDCARIKTDYTTMRNVWCCPVRLGALSPTAASGDRRQWYPVWRRSDDSLKNAIRPYQLRSLGCSFTSCSSISGRAPRSHWLKPSSRSQRATLVSGMCSLRAISLMRSSCPGV